MFFTCFDAAVGEGLFGRRMARAGQSGSRPRTPSSVLPEAVQRSRLTMFAKRTLQYGRDADIGSKIVSIAKARGCRRSGRR